MEAMTLATLMAEIVGFPADILADFSVYVSAAAVVSVGLWALRKILKAAR